MSLDPHPWAEQLDSLLAHAWQRLTRGVHDRHAPARHPTLATVSPEGWPQARTVVLRAARRSEGVLEIHTHAHSPKIADLSARPVAALHVWDPGSHLQIRIQADVEIAQGDDVASRWSVVPEKSRTAYSRGPVPGHPISEALAYETDPDPAAFAVLQLHVRSMDLLHLGPQHRRAQFSANDGWAGCWLVP